MFAGLVLQALVVALIASAIGVVVGIALDIAIPPGGSIPFSASAGRLITSTIYLVIAALIGCAFSLRRVLRVDPASAIGASDV